jgi:hypothetical protein
VPNREALDLGEIAKKSDTEASYGFLADEADEMRGNEIVAIEFLIHRTILLGKINRGSNRGHQHQVGHVPCDSHGHRFADVIPV